MLHIKYLTTTRPSWNSQSHTYRLYTLCGYCTALHVSRSNLLWFVLFRVVCICVFVHSPLRLPSLRCLVYVSFRPIRCGVTFSAALLCCFFIYKTNIYVWMRRIYNIFNCYLCHSPITGCPIYYAFLWSSTNTAAYADIRSYSLLHYCRCVPTRMV